MIAADILSRQRNDWHPFELGLMRVEYKYGLKDLTMREAPSTVRDGRT